MITCLTYIATILPCFFTFGLIGAFASVKHPLAQKLDLTESFLGMVCLIYAQSMLWCSSGEYSAAFSFFSCTSENSNSLTLSRQLFTP